MGALVERCMFRPPARPQRHTSSVLMVPRGTQDGKIPVQLFGIVPGARTRAVIVYSHGNAADLQMCAAECAELAQRLRCIVVAYDYTGYGLSLPADALPSAHSAVMDLFAVLQFLVGACRVPLRSITLLGSSIGSGPTCAVAARVAGLNGILLVGAFASVMAVGLGALVPPALLEHVGPFQNTTAVQNALAPVMVVHGTADSIVPCYHGRCLVAATPLELRRPPLWVFNAGHNDALARALEDDASVARLRAFVHGDP